MSLTPGKPQKSLSKGGPKNLSSGVPYQDPSGGSNDLSASVSKTVSPGVSKELPLISKSLSPGSSTDLAQKASASLSPSGSKNFSSGAAKSLSGVVATTSAGNDGTHSTPNSSIGKSSGKAALTMLNRSPPGSGPASGQCPKENVHSDALATRLWFGKDGSDLVVHTNHFDMKLGNMQNIYLHSVAAKASYERKCGKDDNRVYKTLPVDVSPKKIKRVLALLLDQQSADFSHSATDYAGIIVSTTRLVSDKGFNTWPVEYHEIEETRLTVSKRLFSVRVQHHKIVDVARFAEYLSSGKASPTIEDKNDILNALNLMLSRQPNQEARTVVIGNTRHFVKQPRPGDFGESGGASRAWFGYERSVRGSFRGFLLQINCAASAFYTRPRQGLTLDWLINEWSPNEASHPTNRRELEEFINKLRVTANSGSLPPYTVFGLAEPDTRGERPTPSRVSFMKKIYDNNAGSKKTLKAVAAPKKATPLNYREVPTTVRQHMDSLGVSMTDYQKETGLVINVGSKSRPVYIPAETLRFEEGFPFRQLLGSAQTQRMVNITSKSARETRNLIVERGLEIFGVADGQEGHTLRAAFNIGLSFAKPMAIKARVLKPPGLRYNSGNHLHNPGTKGSWLLRQQSITLHAVVESPVWTVIGINDSNNSWCSDSASDTFRSKLDNNLRRYCSATSAAPLQIALAKSKYQIPTDSNMTIRAGLEEMLDVVQKRNNDLVRKISLIFVILPSKNATMYDTLKHLAEFKYGIHTICTVRTGVDLKDKVEFYVNLMLKCNLKIGGTNTVLDLDPKADKEVHGLLASEPILIVGADVTHAGVGAKMGTRSIVAVVASRHSRFQQYPATLRSQSNRTEIIEELEPMMTQHLQQFEKKAGKLPRKIIFYRDGVSQGEFAAVRTDEISSIKKAFTKAYEPVANHPKLLFLCVIKRSNARFYPQGELRTDEERRIGTTAMTKNHNSWPGLVVDNDVTSQLYYDFYLQSHHSLKGTARPAHYVVVLDEIGVSPDVLQRATYWQCYTFGRSLQAISAHPAARLADVACTRGRVYLRQFLDAGSDNESELGAHLTPGQKRQEREVREADTYAAALRAWGEGVHENIAGSMHHI